MTLSRIAEKYRRLRHTYGYGVHSPYAYFMLELLRRHPGYSYYADEQISLSASKKNSRISKLKRRALMLHRLIGRFPVRDIFISGNLPQPLLEAIMKADSRVRFHTSEDSLLKSDLILICNIELCARKIFHAVEAGKMAIIFTDEAVDHILREFHEFPGLMLYSHDFLLLKKRPGMEFTKYSVLL